MPSSLHNHTIIHGILILVADGRHTTLSSIYCFDEGYEDCGRENKSPEGIPSSPLTTSPVVMVQLHRRWSTLENSAGAVDYFAHGRTWEKIDVCVVVVRETMRAEVVYRSEKHMVRREVETCREED
nr:hypothetical protein Iba_chr07cCG6890 [Ipomoea batatas]